MTAPGGWELLVIVVLLLFLAAVIAGAVFVGIRLANRGKRPSPPPPAPNDRVS